MSRRLFLNTYDLRDHGGKFSRIVAHERAFFCGGTYFIQHSMARHQVGPYERTFTREIVPGSKRVAFASIRLKNVLGRLFVVVDHDVDGSAEMFLEGVRVISHAPAARMFLFCHEIADIDLFRATFAYRFRDPTHKEV